MSGAEAIDEACRIAAQRASAHPSVPRHLVGPLRGFGQASATESAAATREKLGGGFASVALDGRHVHKVGDGGRRWTGEERTDLVLHVSVRCGQTGVLTLVLRPRLD